MEKNNKVRTKKELLQLIKDRKVSYLDSKEELLQLIKDGEVSYYDLKDVGYAHESYFVQEAVKNMKKEEFLQLIKDGEVDYFDLKVAGYGEDFDLVMETVKCSGGIDFEYIPPKFRDDPEIALAAVMRDGKRLEYASPRLRDNKDIVLTAIRRTMPYAISALFNASPRLQEDPEMIEACEEAVKWKGDYFENRYFESVYGYFVEFLRDGNLGGLKESLQDFAQSLKYDPDITDIDVEKLNEYIAERAVKADEEMKRCLEVEAKFRKEKEELKAKGTQKDTQLKKLNDTVKNINIGEERTSE